MECFKFKQIDFEKLGEVYADLDLTARDLRKGEELPFKVLKTEYLKAIKTISFLVDDLSIEKNKILTEGFVNYQKQFRD